MPSKAIALDASSTVRNSRKAYALSCRAVASRCEALSRSYHVPPHSACGCEACPVLADVLYSAATCSCVASEGKQSPQMSGRNSRCNNAL